MPTDQREISATQQRRTPHDGRDKKKAIRAALPRTGVD